MAWIAFLVSFDTAMAAPEFITWPLRWVALAFVLLAVGSLVSKAVRLASRFTGRIKDQEPEAADA